MYVVSVRATDYESGEVRIREWYVDNISKAIAKSKRAYSGCVHTIESVTDFTTYCHILKINAIELVNNNRIGEAIRVLERVKQMEEIKQ